MIDLDRLATPGVLADLRRRHAEPHRRYHAWAHVTALLGWAAIAAGRLHDPDMVTAAILFHDAVYDPRSTDNEARSTVLLRTCEGLCLTAAQRETAARLVEATAAHLPPDDLTATEFSDLTHFLDMDLSILAANFAIFDLYERHIRVEYAHVSDDEFARGRRAVLTRFAERPTLYFSPWGQGLFEAAARRNIERSLERATWPLAEALT